MQRGMQRNMQSNPGMNRVLFLLTLSVVINYIDRSNLSIAAPLIKDELGISASQLGTLLSAFFWTYGLMQIPAGWLVDHLDVKWVLAAGFFVWSLATALTSFLHGFMALITIRIILGFGESVVFPSYSKIIGTHFTEDRRGFANSLIMAGLALGPAFGMLIGGSAIGRFGWRPFFLALGLGGLLWLAPWWAWMPRRTDSPTVMASHSPGLLFIFRQRSAWGTCLGQFCLNYYLYFLVTWLPFYLVRGRHLSMNGMAKSGSLLFLMSAISSTAWGKLSDRWINAGSSPTFVRKGSMALGYAGVGISLPLMALAPDRLFTLTLAATGIFVGIACCNTWSISQTIAGPQMIGRWAGVQNFVGNFAGAVSPWLTGYLIDRTGQFYWGFFITAAVAWLGALAWTLVVGRVEEVRWEEHSRQALDVPAYSTLNHS